MNMTNYSASDSTRAIAVEPVNVAENITRSPENPSIVATVEAAYRRHLGKVEFVAGVVMTGMGGLVTWLAWNTWWPMLGIFLMIIGLISLLVPERR